MTLRDAIQAAEFEWDEGLDVVRNNETPVDVTERHVAAWLADRDARLREALDRLSRAIEDPGIRPDIHREALARLHREWPTLADAIDHLLAEWKRIG